MQIHVQWNAENNLLYNAQRGKNSLSEGKH